MHKLVLFDWGNVLLDSDSNIYTIYDARRDIVDELNPKDKQKLMDMFDDGRFWTTSGKMLDILIRKYITESDCSCSIQAFKECYLKYYRKVPWFGRMVSLVNKLAQMMAYDSRFSIGILSTLCEMDLELIKDYVDLDNIDYCFFSFNIGAVKPDFVIYDTVEVISQVAKDNILFIDDNEDNIKAAWAKGWNAVLATGSDFKMVRNACESFLGIS